ncbi:MAG: hypothetical protein V3T19_05300 [Acidiferrobacterales bacterium]
MKIALLGAGLMGQRTEDLKAKGAAIVEEQDEAIRSVVSMILGRELGECGLFSIVQRGESRRRGRELKILGKVSSV